MLLSNRMHAWADFLNKRGSLFVIGRSCAVGHNRHSSGACAAWCGAIGIRRLSRLIVGGAALLSVLLLSQPFSGNRAGFHLPAGPVLLAAGCMAIYQVLFFAGVRYDGCGSGHHSLASAAPRSWPGCWASSFARRAPGLALGYALPCLLLTGCALLVLTGDGDRCKSCGNVDGNRRRGRICYFLSGQ